MCLGIKFLPHTIYAYFNNVQILFVFFPSSQYGQTAVIFRESKNSATWYHCYWGSSISPKNLCRTIRKPIPVWRALPNAWRRLVRALSYSDIPKVKDQKQWLNARWLHGSWTNVNWIPRSRAIKNPPGIVSSSQNKNTEWRHTLATLIIKMATKCIWDYLFKNNTKKYWSILLTSGAKQTSLTRMNL
jgi:hypothetical protein